VREEIEIAYTGMHHPQAMHLASGWDSDAKSHCKCRECVNPSSRFVRSLRIKFYKKNYVSNEIMKIIEIVKDLYS